MNLPHLLHETTGRMRKARRRGAHYRKRAQIWGLVFVAWLFLPTHLLPWWLRGILVASALVSYVRAGTLLDWARVYGRVVDRCQGSILTILAIQHERMDDIVSRRDPNPGDKRRWS